MSYFDDFEDYHCDPWGRVIARNHPIKLRPRHKALPGQVLSGQDGADRNPSKNPLWTLCGLYLTQAPKSSPNETRVVHQNKRVTCKVCKALIKNQTEPI